jgi:hypothetical protein
MMVLQKAELMVAMMVEPKVVRMAVRMVEK